MNEQKLTPEQEFSLAVIGQLGFAKIVVLASYLEILPSDLLRNAFENGATVQELVKDTQEFYSMQVH